MQKQIRSFLEQLMPGLMEGGKAIEAAHNNYTILVSSVSRSGVPCRQILSKFARLEFSPLCQRRMQRLQKDDVLLPQQQAHCPTASSTGRVAGFRQAQSCGSHNRLWLIAVASWLLLVATVLVQWLLMGGASTTKFSNEEVHATVQPALANKEAASQAAVAAVKQQNTETGTTTDRAFTVEACRALFGPTGQGGNGASTHAAVLRACEGTPLTFDVCNDLRKFTGLAENEFLDRLARTGRFHFEAEHDYWNPTSTEELAWYYSTSVNYLFANALHGVWAAKIKPIASKEYEPVLDYSGGVGNNILYLAEKGIKCQYFGIGLMEFQFAQYRVWKRGFQDLVQFQKPYASKTGYKFDPINGPLPRDGSLGAIIAMDVFEHIPKYHLVVEAMVESLRIGGAIVEVSPFAKEEVLDGEQDLRVHLSNGGITMQQAMGPKMARKGPLWVKIAA